MERLSIYYEWSVPSVTSNTYILVVIDDEYLRLPFVFPCPKVVKFEWDALLHTFGQRCVLHVLRIEKLLRLKRGCDK